MRVFVTGASGLVGRRVISKLQAQHEIVAISRDIDRLSSLGGVECVEGDVTQQGDWQDVAASCDAIVHLAGAGIMDKRWTYAYKNILHGSRIESTKRCAEVRASVLISASATGFYGDCGDKELTESSPAGGDFLARLASDWESAASTSTGRIVTLRFSMILDKDGGALKKMKLPFQLGLGGPIGNGNQYWPWVHMQDVCSVIQQALTSEWEGAFNVVAPQQVTCKQFVKTLGKVLRRPAVTPMPKWALRLLIGEASGVLTASQRVVPEALQQEGFEWMYPALYKSLESEI